MVTVSNALYISITGWTVTTVTNVTDVVHKTKEVRVMNDYQHPTDEQPQIAWARASKLSYYPKHEKLIIEVIIHRDGHEVVGRSLTVFLNDPLKDPSVIELLRKIADDMEAKRRPVSAYPIEREAY